MHPLRWSCPTCSYMHTFLFKVKRSKNKILLVGWPYYEAIMHFVKSASTTATSVIGLSDSDVCKIFKSPFSPTVLIKVVIV